MLNFAASNAVEIIPIPADCRFLDELSGEGIDGINASLREFRFRAAADFRDEHGVAIVDRADNRREAVFLAVAALAIQVHAPMTHELGARGAELVDLEFLGVSEVLVDEARTLGRHRD